MSNDELLLLLQDEFSPYDVYIYCLAESRVNNIRWDEALKNGGFIENFYEYRCLAVNTMWWGEKAEEMRLLITEGVK